MKNFTLITIILFTLFGQNLLAQDVEDEGVSGEFLEDMSLEALMSMSVTSASKKEEGLYEAPSIISTITAEEIEMFGAQDIYEILERAPSFYGLSSYFFRKNSIGLRGDLPNHVNTHILFLIDGRPFRESILGGQNVALLSTFPVGSIKQIEIIRGPGSVLYGSNAYVGVVNIITKKALTSEIVAQGNIGSYNSSQVQVNGGTSVSDLKINGGLNIRNTDGFHFVDSARRRGPNRQLGETDFSEKVMATNLQLDYKGFNLSGFYGSNDLGHITSATSLPGTYESQRLFMDLGYNGVIIPEKYRLSVNMTYNNIRDKFDNGFFNETSTSSAISDDYVIEFTNFFSLTDKLEITLGGSLSMLSGEQSNGPGFSVESYNTDWANGYVQAQYNPNSWLSLVAGGQLNKVPNIDLNFVPRLAAIASFKSGFGGKIMYGQAFRAPFRIETNLASQVVVGFSGLIPETVSTYEAQVFYASEKGNVALTYYNSNQSDLITRVRNLDTLINASLVFANVGELKSEGLELEAKYSILKNLYVNASYSYQTNKDSNGNKNVTRLPSNMLKIGAMLNIRNYVKIGMHNAFYSSPYDNESAAESLGTLGAFNWMTAKLDFNISNILSFEYPKVGLNIRAVNLLNEEVYNPEIIFGDYNAIQNKPGAAYHFGAYVKF